jgi:oligogalacturonide lyase
VCQGGGFGRGIQIIEIDLAKLFADSEAGTMKPAANYERVRGTIPTNMIAGSDMGLDANEGLACFRVTGDDVGQHLAPGTKIESGFGPRNMGAGPAGLRSMNLKTGEIVFCWETGGKAPQRTRTVMADGTGLRPLYPEAPYEWITHEAVITSNEVAPAILGHRRVGALHAGGDARRCALNGPARLGEFGGRSQSPGAR